MSVDNILNLKIAALDADSNPLGGLTDGLSVGLGTGNAGDHGLDADNGGSLVILGDDGATSAVHLGVPSLGGAADNPAMPHYYTGVSKPVTVSFLPQPPGSDASDGSSSMIATAPTVAFFDDFGGDLSGGAA